MINDELPPRRNPRGFLIAAMFVLVFSFGFTLLFKSVMAPKISPQLGQNFPPIESAGWINGPGPAAEDLRGRVVLVDAWAYWCGPCRAATPYMMELHQKYKDRGVSFLGLTSEGLDAESISESRKFIEAEKVPWPNAYGAVKTLAALEVDTIPQFWIIDRENRIVLHEIGWSGSSISNMEQALIKALESPVQKSAER